MKNIHTKWMNSRGFALLLAFCFLQVAHATDDEFKYYEAENMTLLNYTIQHVDDAFKGAVITLDADFGSATVSLEKPTGYYDIQLSYVLEEEASYAFEVYIDDELVDAWMSNDYTGHYTEDPLKRVTHLTQNVHFQGKKKIEIVGYAGNGAKCQIDNMGLRASTVVDISNNMTWSSSAAISSLLLGGVERISSGSSFIVNEFSGSKMSSIDQTTVGYKDQVVTLTDKYGFAKFLFRVERFDLHVRLKLIGMECIPRGDKSLAPKLTIACSSGVNFELLDEQVEVEKSGNTITLYWTKLAERGLLPGGYLALYADGTAEENQQALDEINSSEEIELPKVPSEPTNISLSNTKIMENNSIGDMVGTFSAEDPQGDIASYALVAGEGDTDNSSFIIIADTLKTAVVLDYEEAELLSIRVQVSDSTANTLEKAFILVVLDDESDNNIGIDYDFGEQLGVYPNPARSKLYIENADVLEGSITNILGERIGSFKVNSNLIDISELPAGMYVLSVKCKGEIFHEKFIKE